MEGVARSDGDLQDPGAQENRNKQGGQDSKQEGCFPGSRGKMQGGGMTYRRNDRKESGKN